MDAPNVTLCVKVDPAIVNIFKTTGDLARIVTNLKDVNFRLMYILENMKTPGLAHRLIKKFEKIPLKIEDSIEQLSALNCTSLDFGSVRRQIHEAEKSYKENESNRAENVERGILKNLEKRFEELKEEYLKYITNFRRLESEIFKSYIPKLPPVPDFSGDRSAADEGQVAFKNEIVEESSVPDSSGYHSAADEEQVAFKDESGEENSAPSAESKCYWRP